MKPANSTAASMTMAPPSRTGVLASRPPFLPPSFLSPPGAWPPPAAAAAAASDFLSALSDIVLTRPRISGRGLLSLYRQRGRGACVVCGVEEGRRFRGAGCRRLRRLRLRHESRIFHPYRRTFNPLRAAG